MRIDPIILGHNQFIGVDHLSQDRARNRTDRFGDIQKILDVVKSFYDMGGSLFVRGALSLLVFILGVQFLLFAMLFDMEMDRSESRSGRRE